MPIFLCAFLWLFGAGFVMNLAGDYGFEIIALWPAVLGIEFCRFVRESAKEEKADG